MSKQARQAIQVGSLTGDTVNQRYRDSVQALESRMLGLPQVELDLFQHFAHGVYARELHIPAGVLLTGKIHKYSCINVLLKGTIAIVTEAGKKLMKAPAIFPAPAGVKRTGYAVTDTIWVTVHANPDNMERSPEAMADFLTVPNFEKLEEMEVNTLEVNKLCQ